MAAFHGPLRAGELLPRYSFIEPLLEGRRVLEVGAAAATDGASAAFLAERGAAAVLSVDDDPEGVARAAAAVESPFVQFRRAALAELPRGAFDLVLVAEGGPLAADPERVAALRALLSRDGLLVTAVPASGAAGLPALAGHPLPAEVPSYESFVSALAAEFPVVEVATQSAMVGYVLAPAPQPGDAEPDVTVDGSLAGAAEAAYYVAVCGEQPTGLGGLTVVALPHRPLADRALENGAAAREHLSCRASAGLEGELDRVRQALHAAEEALVGKDVEIAEALGRVAERDGWIAERDGRLAALEVEAEAALQRAQSLERDVEQEREALFEARRELDAAAAGAREIEDARAARAEAEASAQAARAEAQAARAALEAALARAEGAEARAGELDQASEALRAELAEARRESERAAELEHAGGEARRELESARVRADEGEARSAELAARLAEAEERARAAAAEAAGAREARQGSEAELAELRSRLEAAEGRARREAERSEAEAARAAELEREMGTLGPAGGEKARLEAEAAEARNAAEAAQAQAAALEAELQAVRWEKDDLEQRLRAASPGSAGEVARLREELAARTAEIEELRGAAEGAAPSAGPGPAEGAPARVGELEVRLAEALRRLADAEAAASAARAAAEGWPGEEAPADLQKLAGERDALAAQLAEREARLARLQRELADKTDRLGRLARELGELRSQGPGKLTSP